MKILIVEDDFDKREKIRFHVESELGLEVEIIECESLRSGLKTIIEGSHFDLILLDMSMPSFDTSDVEPGGGEPESFAGREIMAQMRLRKIFFPVVVITQYKSFEQGTVDLEQLIDEFSSQFKDFFRGFIYYNSAIEGWKKQLSEHLKSLGN